MQPQKKFFRALHIIGSPEWREHIHAQKLSFINIDKQVQSLKLSHPGYPRFFFNHNYIIMFQKCKKLVIGFSRK